MLNGIQRKPDNFARNPMFEDAVLRSYYNPVFLIAIWAKFISWPGIYLAKTNKLFTKKTTCLFSHPKQCSISFCLTFPLLIKSEKTSFIYSQASRDFVIKKD